MCRKMKLINLDDIGYGNPSTDILEDVGKELSIINLSMIDQEVFNVPFPKNSSETAHKELLLLNKIQNIGLNQEKYVEFTKIADKSLEDSYNDFLSEFGLSLRDYHNELLNELAILALKIKLKFNRMRPYQLANILRVPVFPMSSKSATTASYPSGHTLQSYVISEILAEEHSEIADELINFAIKISLSRNIGGFHFPSDIIYGLRIGKAILPAIDRR